MGRRARVLQRREVEIASGRKAQGPDVQAHLLRKRDLGERTPRAPDRNGDLRSSYYERIARLAETGRKRDLNPRIGVLPARAT